MTDLHIDELRSIVVKYFPVFNVHWETTDSMRVQSVAFYIRPHEDQLEDSFDDLRVELKELGYIPLLRQDRGEYVIYISKRPEMTTRSIVVNFVMFILTLISTVWAGAVLWAEHIQLDFGEAPGEVLGTMLGVLFNPTTVGYGALFFALPLLLILGIHELGHYFMARRHRVNASLPFFIPVPPIISLIGTFGAFISLREPIPSKKALIDIGAAGPIAGFIVALPVTAIGFYLTGVSPVFASPTSGTVTYLGSPLIFQFIDRLIPTPANAVLHPTAFAGWVGILVTFLNLLPAGQLDGGHIARALLGDKARYASYATVIVMITLSIITQYYGWMIFILLIMFLGMRHPPPLNDMTRLDVKRKGIGVFAMVMFILCFVAVPFSVAYVDQPAGGVEIATEGATDIVVGLGEEFTYELTLTNTGTDTDTFHLYYNTSANATIVDALEGEPIGDTANASTIQNGTDSVANGNKSGEGNESSSSGTGSNSTVRGENWTILRAPTMISLERDAVFGIDLTLIAPTNGSYGASIELNISAVSTNFTEGRDSIHLTVRIGRLTLRCADRSKKVLPDTIALYPVEVANKWNATGRIELDLGFNGTVGGAPGQAYYYVYEPAEDTADHWGVDIDRSRFVLSPGNRTDVKIWVLAPESGQTGDHSTFTLTAYLYSNGRIVDSAQLALETQIVDQKG